jgi:acyl carrier protein
VSNHNQIPTSTELRRFLKAKLPEYMVPSTFVFLEALPLTPNGKLDRRALPAPDQSRPDLENPFVAPRTAVEDRLTKIWAEALGLDQVGIHDNFFELGGNSLLATQVISRINDAFNVNLSPQGLYETQTVAELATTVMQGQTGSRS